MKYVLDTNALLNRPEFIKNHRVILIPSILRELEQLELKRSNYEMQYRIREAKRMIKKYEDNVEYLDEVNHNDLTKHFLGYESDYVGNILLAYVMKLIDVDTELITVYTDDVLLQMKLKSKKIHVTTSENLYGKVSDNYDGVNVWEYDSEKDEDQDLLSKLYEKGIHENYFELCPNEYLLIVDKRKGLGEEIPVDIMIYQNHCHISVFKKPNTLPSPNNDGTLIKPLNIRQNIAIHALNDEDSKVKIIKGRVASGKSYLTFSKAKELLDKGIVQKIVFIGNSVSEKSSNAIGFLPGSLEEKVGSSYSYISDILGARFLLDEMVRLDELSVEYCGFIRSRTFTNSVVLVSEAQNFTIEQLELILTRVGKDSYLIIDGDYSQSDINNSGFRRFVNKLRTSDLVSVVTLTEIERSEVAELADLLSD